MTKPGRPSTRTRDVCLAICALAGVVLVWSRLANLGTSFWSDEAYSAYYYAGRGPRAVFFGTYVPNNHMLYNLVSWITTGAVGRFEASYRIGSVVPGIAAVALAAWWAWKRLGPIAATLIVVLATVSPVHLVLTPQARGYGLAMFAGVVMLIGAVRASDHEAGRDVALFAAGALVGIFTLPVFALAAASQAAVLLWNRRLRKHTLIACGVISAASLAFYAPVLGDIADNADQRFGSRLAVVNALTGVYHHLAAPTISNAMPGAPHSALNDLATFAMIALLVVAAVVRLVRAKEGALLAHLTVPVFGTYTALVIGRFYVQPRFASYLLFHVLVLLAIGGQQLWDVARVSWARAVAIVAIAAVALAGSARVADLTAAQAAVPWENYQFVANLAKSMGFRYIVSDTTHPGALYYYLGPKRVLLLGPTAVAKQAYCGVTGRFIFVDDAYRRTTPLNLKCLTDRRAFQIHVPQQEHPPIRAPGKLTVYLVPATRAGARLAR